MKKNFKTLRSLGLLVLGLVIINLLASKVYKRFDLTQNQRYTLSEQAKSIVSSTENPLIVQVFLKGDFPSNFKRLSNETRYLLEEFSAFNHQIKFNFINPLADSQVPAQQIGQQFFESGMPPRRLSVRKNGENTQSLIFPWAVATYQGQSVKIPLLQMTPGDSNEEMVNKSVQSLEYAFTDAFKRLLSKQSKKIAILKGNGELPDLQMASFLKTVGAFYHTAPFTLDSVATNPQRTLQELDSFDLVVVAKPTEAFTEKEKFVLDQYIMNGGKSLWLVEAVAAEKDSLFTGVQGKMLAYPRDLNLLDFFFKYGIRITPSLINDLHADNLILATGQGKQTQFTPYPWYYSPLVEPQNNHPITHNLAPIRFDFANPMDTLKNGVDKTVLLRSSVATRIEGTPEQINLEQVITQKPDFKTYTNPHQIMAVLLEGQFTSVYKNRVKPFHLSQVKDESKPTQMVVISDGDVIKNDVRKGQPTSLDYDPKTGQTYGNKAFLLNTVNYMLDDSGLLQIRTKKVDIPFLNPQKITAKRSFWQIVNLGVPLFLLIIVSLGFTYYRRRKYRK